MYYSICTYYSIYNLLVISDAKFLCRGTFCVGTDTHVDPNLATFQHVANVLPTYCRHCQLSRQAQDECTNVDATNVKTTAVTIGNSADNAAVNGDDAPIDNTIIAAHNIIMKVADSADDPNVAGNTPNIANNAVDTRTAGDAAINVANTADIAGSARDVANTAGNALTTDSNAIDGANTTGNSANNVADTADAATAGNAITATAATTCDAVAATMATAGNAVVITRDMITTDIAVTALNFIINPGRRPTYDNTDISSIGISKDVLVQGKCSHFYRSFVNEHYSQLELFYTHLITKYRPLHLKFRKMSKKRKTKVHTRITALL